MSGQPQVGTKWASPEKVALGCIAFLVWWVLAVFPAVPCLPIGRTGGSILGAVLMVVFQVISPTAAFASVDLPILALLFGTMVISVYLERAYLFKYLGKILSWKSFGGFVLKLCKQKQLPKLPFLMALATSANIGSAGTAIGNPQNLVIAVQSGISFGKFLAGIIPAVVVGIVVNTALLLAFYWKSLSAKSGGHAEGGRDIEEGPDKELATVASSSSEIHARKIPEPGVSIEDSNVLPKEINGSTALEINSQHVPKNGSSSPGKEDNVSPSPLSNERESSTLPGQDLEPEEPLDAIPSGRIRKRLWITGVYAITVGFLAALLAGLNLSWSALAAAVALMVLDFSDAGPSLDKVSYSLLVFFSGMFIAVEGFNITGAPGAFWKAVEPKSHIDNAKGLAVLALVIILLSNVASNVPTVLLLGARVAASAGLTHGASVTKAWLILAWVSTVAGNLTLLGSAANLIVSEQARTSDLSYNFSFRKHLPFGFLSTLIVVAVGLPLIQG